MKRTILTIALCVIAISQMAVALPYEFSSKNNTTAWISTDGPGVASNGWFYLDFPNAGSAAKYTGTEGIFEYDDVIGDLVDLSITLKGKDDNSSAPIDVYISFNANHNDTMKIASYNVANNTHFTLEMDLLNERLIYNGDDKGSLLQTDLTENFLGADGVWVGYGCHYTHCSTSIDVAAVPEPATLAILGLGTLMLNRRKRFGR